MFVNFCSSVLGNTIFIGIWNEPFSISIRNRVTFWVQLPTSDINLSSATLEIFPKTAVIPAIELYEGVVQSVRKFWIEKKVLTVTNGCFRQMFLSQGKKGCHWRHFFYYCHRNESYHMMKKYFELYFRAISIGTFFSECFWQKNGQQLWSDSISRRRNLFISSATCNEQNAFWEKKKENQKVKKNVHWYGIRRCPINNGATIH